MIHNGDLSLSTLAIRNGIPSLIIPKTEKQMRWANRIESLGAGLILPYKKFDRRVFKKILLKIFKNQQFRINAHINAEKMREENGIKMSTEFIYSILNWTTKTQI